MHRCKFHRTVRPGATLLLLLALLASSEIAVAAGTWRTEFEEVCGKTADAELLSLVDLQALMVKGERVKTVLEEESESVRIIYQKRVQKCLDLYRSFIEMKLPEGNTPTPAQ